MFLISEEKLKWMLTQAWMEGDTCFYGYTRDFDVARLLNDFKKNNKQNVPSDRESSTPKIPNCT